MLKHLLKNGIRKLSLLLALLMVVSISLSNLVLADSLNDPIGDESTLTGDFLNTPENTEESEGAEGTNDILENNEPEKNEEDVEENEEDTEALFGEMPAFLSLSEPEFVNDVAGAVTLTSEIVTNTKWDTESYAGLYAIPPSMIASFDNNGGSVSGNPLSNAFDGNWGTFWKSALDNNRTEIPGQYDRYYYGEEYDFKNWITVDFTQEVTFSSFLYQSETNTERGYPLILKIYKENGGLYELIGTCNSSATKQKVKFDFNTNITATKIALYWESVYKGHKYCPTATEFMFLEPESEYVEAVDNLFTDYRDSQIVDTYNSPEAIANLIAQVENRANYIAGGRLKTVLDRAKQIVENSDSLTSDERRLFTTGPLTSGQRSVNQIYQWGDIRKYCGEELQMSSVGTNRQITGVAYRYGEPITVYVEADNPDDPLPQINFSQSHGSFNSWSTGSLNLKRGRNVFTPPNFITNAPNYYHTTYPLYPGGPIYLINPYDKTQQTGNIKIYIEGGYLFPTFTLASNDSEDVYKSELASYVTAFRSEDNANPGNQMNDLTEIDTGHTILTIRATSAYWAYFDQNRPVRGTLQTWNDTFRKYLIFDGEQFEPGQPYYDPRNEHINVNFRTTQNFAGQFLGTANDHICLYSGDGRGADEFVLGENGGWGIVHEFGHAIDLKDRIVGEFTNNMIANYNQNILQKDWTGTPNRYDYGSITEKLESDDVSLDWNTDKHLAVWWNIETAMPGFWAKLNNIYRHPEDFGINVEDARNMTQSERHVYYASIATGIDLSYYFERWNLAYGNQPFKSDSASEVFKEAMEEAKTDESNPIQDVEVKFWYVNEGTYVEALEKKENGENYIDIAAIVSGATAGEKPATPSLSTNVDGEHILTFDKPSAWDGGTEIIQGNETNGWNVISFQKTGNQFVDKTVYDNGYVPNYKIRFYNKQLLSSKESDSVKDSKVLSILVDGNVYKSFEINTGIPYVLSACDMPVANKTFAYYQYGTNQLAAGDPISIVEDTEITAIYTGVSTPPSSGSTPPSSGSTPPANGSTPPAGGSGNANNNPAGGTGGNGGNAGVTGNTGGAGNTGGSGIGGSTGNSGSTGNTGGSGTSQGGYSQPTGGSQSSSSGSLSRPPVTSPASSTGNNTTTAAGNTNNASTIPGVNVSSTGNTATVSIKTAKDFLNASQGASRANSFIIQTSSARVEIDGVALNSIVDQAKNNDFQVVVEDAKRGDLSNTQQRALSALEEKVTGNVEGVFSAYIMSGGQRITNFGGGLISVGKIGFTPAPGRNPANYHVYYIPSEGAPTRHVTWYDAGHLYYTTGHFSDYAIVYDESITNDGEGAIFRLYNSRTGFHLLTSSKNERNAAINKGWVSEGIEFLTGGGAENVTVYRMYYSKTGEHLYTDSEQEIEANKTKGWSYEGKAFTTAMPKSVYRLYNGKVHHYTSNAKEIEVLVSRGWINEGVAF